jgi:hypothetical protein
VTGAEVFCEERPYIDEEEDKVWGCGRRGWRRREPLKSGVDADDIILNIVVNCRFLQQVRRCQGIDMLSANSFFSTVSGSFGSGIN